MYITEISRHNNQRLNDMTKKQIEYCGESKLANNILFLRVTGVR